MSDELVDIYAQLEADILQDMARRIARLGKITESTIWQAQLLAETGALKKDVNKILRKYDPKIRKEVRAIYNDAMVKNARADNRIFSEALGHGVSDINAQVMLASIQKTHSDLSRLTITTAYTTEQQFIEQANAAYMQVVTGAFDYDTAMRNACNKLAAEGITGVQYRNGRPVRLTIENAVRMNIITGVNQTASAMTMNNCEDLGCDLVETTAHIGARPEHEEWQGQVFSISGTNPKYRPFSVCGLGEVDGLCGINCRHSYYPYFEGLEKHYTQADLDEMESATVEYNGVKMPRYDAEEKLRGIERHIRRYKREALTDEAAGVDSTRARRKLGEWQAKARDFTQQTGLERDRAREFIGTIDGKQPRGIMPQTTPATPQTQTPPKAQPQTPPAVKPAVKESVKVNVSGFADAFNQKTNAVSTAELVNYMNTRKNADSTMLELFNNMNKAERLQTTPLKISNSQSRHYFARRSGSRGDEWELVLDKIVKNDPDIIGKAGTNLHEITHMLDAISEQTAWGNTSTKTVNAISKARKYNKYGADLPSEITALFKEKIQACAELNNSLTTETNRKLKKLGEEYEKNLKDWRQYKKEYNALVRSLSQEYNRKVRNLMDGADALMDIYDALSEGAYLKNGVVSFGHGATYYYNHVDKQAAEIFANYGRLAITNPELITLLKKYEPELVETLEETATEILTRLRGAK